MMPSYWKMLVKSECLNTYCILLKTWYRPLLYYLLLLLGFNEKSKPHLKIFCSMMQNKTLYTVVWMKTSLTPLINQPSCRQAYAYVCCKCCMSFSAVLIPRLHRVGANVRHYIGSWFISATSFVFLLNVSSAETYCMKCVLFRYLVLHADITAATGDTQIWHLQKMTL